MNDPQTLAFSGRRLPITQGSIAEFAEDPIKSMRNMWATHGEVAALENDNQRIHFIFGPRYNKYVLSDAKRFHTQFFAMRGPRRSSQRRVTSGLLSMNGDRHRDHRRTVMGPFQKRAIVAYHEMVSHVTQQLLSDWEAGQTRDINSDMTDYMLKLTSSILFGVDFSDLALKIGRLTDRWVALNHEVGPAAFISDLDVADLYDELLASAEELEGAVKEMIDIRRSGKLGSDVLSILIRVHDEMGGITDDELIGHITLMFGAAHLTSAHTLTWTLFLLSQHPEVMEKLYNEFQDTLEDGVPKPDDLEKMTYLEQVIKESMRVMPASSYSQRVTSEPVELGPFQLNRGAIVVFSQFMTHHMPDIYEQPERFIPERWETINPSAYEYLPFGAGPRMCIGAPLAMMQFKISLPQILLKHKLSLVAGTEVNAKAMSTMLYPNSPIYMNLEQHDGRFAASPVTGNVHTIVDLPGLAPAHRRAA